MSYEIAVVTREFSEKCINDNVDLGAVLGEGEDNMPLFSSFTMWKVLYHLFNQDQFGGYKIVSKTEKETVLQHTMAETLRVFIRKNIMVFKSCVSDAGTTDSSTSMLAFEPCISDEIRRYDLQSGCWC